MRLFSAKMGKLESALRPFGKYGQQAFQNRMQVEQQAQQEKQQKQELKKGEVLSRILKGEEVSEKENALFTPQEQLGIAKHKQAKELAEIKSANKAPAGGITAQPISPEISAKTEQILKENPNANADDLKIKMDKAGIPPSNSNPYIENRRRQDETNAKTSTEKQKY